jgi:putative two-component system response regulator
MLIIQEGRGKHFDPDIVDAFVVINEEFRLISQRYLD